MIGTEAPIQQKIVDDLADFGWLPVARKEMEALRRGRLGECLIEPLMVDGLRALNTGLSEQEALQVVEYVRHFPDAESFLKALRDGVDIAFSAEEASRHLELVDWREPSQNRFVVTTEFVLLTGAVREPRLDIVCLVNGMPLCVVETKAPTHDWKEGVRDFRGYWEDAPELERYSAVCVATNGFRLRCAPSGATKASQYAEWKDSWPHAVPDGPGDRELEIGVRGLLDPHNLTDIAANFVVFETRAGVTTKKLARYQQFRGANKVVERVVDGDHDRGIVWHTQGSGKSLTMLFAARKLKAVGLGNPTVFIVIDRVDLDDQINETFTAASFDGVARAFRRSELRDLLASDRRGVIVTTVQKFDETMDALMERENVIVLVDEAHRSQEGLQGIRMRAALPKAKFFAFTGTPIEEGARSTWRAFSPELEDGTRERYLDAYTPKEAIDDGATVEVRYEPRLATVTQLRGDELDSSFIALADDLTEEEAEAVKADAARLAVVAKAPARVAAVAADVRAYMRERVDPQGFKAQLVCVDREACAAYADALLAEGLAVDEIAVVFTPRTKDDGSELRRWWAGEQWRRVHGVPAVEEGDVAVDDEAEEFGVGEVVARKKFIDAFKNPTDPLKVLIVCDMLLTGFDAPVEQVMFLDKPLRGAKLLQAIMRTNRPFPERGKDRGVIVDYWGVFEKLQDAFAEFSPDEVELAILDLRELRDQFPVLVAEALALVAGIQSGVSDYEQMMWLLARFTEDKQAAELFEERFQRVQSSYETLAPDAALAPHLDDYKRLVRFRALWRHGARLDQTDSDFDIRDHRPQTHRLVQDAVSKIRLRDDLPVYRIDAEYVKRVDESPGSPEEKAAEVEAAIEFEVRERGEHDPVSRSLSERLERLKERKLEADMDMLTLLDELLGLAGEHARDQEESARLGLSERAQSILAIARGCAPKGFSDERLIELTRAVDDVIERLARTPEAFERDDVLRDIRRDTILLLAANTETQSVARTTFVDDVLAAAVARAGVA